MRKARRQQYFRINELTGRRFVNEEEKCHNSGYSSRLTMGSAQVRLERARAGYLRMQDWRCPFQSNNIPKNPLSKDNVCPRVGEMGSERLEIYERYPTSGST